MKTPLLRGPMRRLLAPARALVLLTACLLAQAALGQDAVVTYYHHDATGNLVVMTDAQGNVVWRASVRPFGRGSAQPADRPLQFAGQALEADLTAESGLYHLGARMFDPLTGRFLSPDPLPLGQIRVNEPQRFNRYTYGLNNPYRYSDRSGLTPLSEEQARASLKRLAEGLDSQGATFEAKLARMLSAASRTFEETIARAKTSVFTRTRDRVRHIIKAAEVGEAELAAGEVTLQGFQKLLHALRASGIIKVADKVGGILLIAYIAYEGGHDIAKGNSDKAIDGFYDAGGFDSSSDLLDPLGITEEIFGDPRETLKRLASGDWNDEQPTTSPSAEPD